jgi:hypothetical protein
MLYDRNNHNVLEFAKEVAGSLGAFATTNQWYSAKFGRVATTKNLIVGAVAISNTHHGVNYEE